MIRTFRYLLSDFRYLRSEWEGAKSEGHNPQMIYMKTWEDVNIPTVAVQSASDFADNPAPRSWFLVEFYRFWRSI